MGFLDTLKDKLGKKEKTIEQLKAETELLKAKVNLEAAKGRERVELENLKQELEETKQLGKKKKKGFGDLVKDLKKLGEPKPGAAAKKKEDQSGFKDHLSKICGDSSSNPMMNGNNNNAFFHVEEKKKR